MKTLKQLAAMIGLILSVMAFTWVYFFMDINRENMVEAGHARTIESASRGRIFTSFVDAVLDTIAGLFRYGIPALFYFVMVALAMLVGTYIYRKFWKDRNLPHNGVFALQRQKLMLVDRNGKAYPALVTTNPNLLTAPILTQVLNGTSEGTFQQQNQLSERGQLHAKMIERQANNLHAATLGDNLSGMTASVVGRVLNPRIIGGSGSSLPEPRDNRMLEVQDEEDENEEQAQPLTIGQAFEQSSTDEWILGRNAKNENAVLRIKTFPHIAIFGATRTGKSSGAAMMVVGHALKNNHKVVILDGDLSEGGDWSPFKRCCEYHKSEPEIFATQMEMLYSEFKRRETNGFDHEITVLIEEYGDINERMTGKDRERANAFLNSMTRKAGKFGMHFVFVDQYPQKWDKLVLQNVAKIVYRIDDGTVLKVYNAETMKEQGEFEFRGTRYDSFHVKPFSQKLVGLSKRTYRYELIDEMLYPKEPEPELLLETEPEQPAATAQETVEPEPTESLLVTLIKRYTEEHPHLKTEPPGYGEITSIIEYVIAETGEPVVKSYVSKTLKQIREANNGNG